MKKVPWRENIEDGEKTTGNYKNLLYFCNTLEEGK